MNANEFKYIKNYKNIIKRPYDLSTFFPELGKMAKAAIPILIAVDEAPEHIYIVFESFIDPDRKMRISIENYEYLLEKESTNVLTVVLPDSFLKEDR